MELEIAKFDENKYSPSTDPAPQNMDKQETPVKQRQLSALIIEDDPLTQLAHKKILSTYSCHVDIAANGQLGVDMAAKGYDLVLLDIGLPDRSGIEVGLEIREQKINKSACILAVTANRDESVKRQCLAAGVDLVLYKPLNPLDIQSVVSHIMAANPNSTIYLNYDEARLALHVLEGKSQEEIADLLELSESAILEIMANLRDKLRCQSEIDLHKKLRSRLYDSIV